MPTIWFILIAIMIVGYVVLDGFDLGAGILHFVIGRTEQERQLVMRSIGPVWDGNEVWLIAGGGTIFFAFPLLYASGFSGFYLPLMIVLWLLIIRGIGIEFRIHSESPTWREFFDGAFTISSTLLAVFFGAALANVIRGVPLQQEQYFLLPLWTNWRVGPNPGILDWYTVIAAVLSLVALALHGALYLALKNVGDVQKRARRVATTLWPILVVLTLASLWATIYVRREVLNNYRDFPVALTIPVMVIASLAGMLVFNQRGEDMRAFLSSCAYLIFMLTGAAVALYPQLLPSTLDPRYSITIYNAAAGHRSLSLGLIWWTFGMLLAFGYVVFVYWMFRGKVSVEADHGYGH